MKQICCLNPECDNPSVPQHTKFCPSCGVALVILRNRYQPFKPLGGGGFAKTYLAVDIDKLNEKCVIKQFAPQTQGTAGLQKATELFLQEAQQLQQLGEHPQIPTLLAYFEDNSRLYLVQQFIDGENLLKELAQQGIFKESKIRDLLQDLLPVLTVIHNQGIIHRDIKPENIMRRRSDGKLILIDFGASKQLQGTVKTGTSIGTFGYSPLEQMQDGKVYPASDLYSLGATCFHLLTGVHPWQLWQEDGYRWVKEWRNHLKQAVNPELADILDKLLQKDYQQRYQSAQEVLLDLNPPQIPPTVPYQHPQVSSSKKQTPPLTSTPKSSRRGFLQVAGLFGGGFVLAVVGQSIFRDNSTPKLETIPTSQPTPSQISEFTSQPTPTPTSESTSQPTPTTDSELRSSVGMDYSELQNLLAAGNWKEADEETRRLMLAVANREYEGWLDTDSIKNFPCTDFRTIDGIWVKYSNGRFGVSVQKRIYQSLGGTDEYNSKIWAAFEEKVGWLKGGDITFDKSAPEGHLPWWGNRGSYDWLGWLFSFDFTCKL
ncbi:serine/threonine protein kinase [Nostoc sp. PCC 7524]|uniref:protein kinase domain-containing protein n=1 Tax=Nostoc sp. (strain ATCC 29411 / PCC 7524) TaxID=28072 RepID=UPI00029F2636|nr:GUN4 domain-containing protein [Nostoc sp. PCC 7524]AFY47493.1 serine/threonine protein kinase [Nostoc sp. PCC 7524]